MTGTNFDLKKLAKMVRVNRQVVNRLKDRVALLESALELVCQDRQMAWLYKNRSERMDPSVPFFDKRRAAFHLRRYEFACEFVAGKSVADIACGTGYGCQLLIEAGTAATVIGVDICPDTISYAKHRHQAPGISFIQADGCATGLDSDSVDVVVSFETIEHVPNDGHLLREFSRVLRPGGMLICSTPNRWPLEIAPHHVREYDRQSFYNTLADSFVAIELFNQNSGSDFKYNHQQPEGIIPTTDDNQEVAECFIAIARKPAKAMS